MASRSTRGARGTVSGPGAGADFRVESNIREVLADLREFDRKLATATRRRLRQAGDDAIEEMRQVLAEPSPGIVTQVHTRVEMAVGKNGAYLRRRVSGFDTAAAKSTTSRGARNAVASALRTRVVAGKTRQTIRISGSGEAFARSYNLARWRHPIRFNPATTSKSNVPWVEQAGRPYFGAVVAKHHRDIYRRVDEALADAIDAIARNRATSSTD